jgi:nicotinamide phosphoribosyltransferase
MKVRKETLPTLLADFYKTSHRAQYPQDTKMIFSNWIPRTSRIPGITKVVSFGVQNFNIKYLIDYFGENFFDRPKQEVLAEYIRFMTFTMGPQFADATHIGELHDLGYFPLTISSIPEGEAVPIGVPMITVINTNDKFFWTTNYIETLISCEVWGPMTSATIAKQYKEILNSYSLATTGSTEGVQFQGHDFSMRGMYGVEAAILSGMGHLASGFVGTDTMPAISRLEYAYGADIEKELVGCSVPATEHSVQCVNGVGSVEQETVFAKRLITEIYPTGIVSMVSDTINLWDVILKVLPAIKNEIMGRDGKLVIRPDSGDPVKIICGDQEAKTEWERKGVIELLWDQFGGSYTAQGFKILDSHIGAIYGDSITIDRCRMICKLLKIKGFASVNIFLGIGSYTYQYNTRDTFGFAMKSTYALVGDTETQVYKNPITDNGTKKSLKGLCVVLKDENGEYFVKDKLGWDEYQANLDNDQLQIVYENGALFNKTTLAEIRERVSK